MGWFARRAALIVIFFDVNKMGVSREMTQVKSRPAEVSSLPWPGPRQYPGQRGEDPHRLQQGRQRARDVSQPSPPATALLTTRDLTDSLSGLQFNLAKSMPTPEVPKVYVTSLDSLAHEYKGSSQEHHDRFARDKEHLLQDIDRVRHNTYSR